MTAKQLTLLNVPITATVPITVISPVKADPSDPATPLSTAINRYLDTQLRAGRSLDTIKAYRNDLNILVAYTTPEHPIGHFSLSDLVAFLTWMQNRPNTSCKPKTLERRITSLRSFFAWLSNADAIPTNPAAQLQYQAHIEYMPQLPSVKEINAAISAAAKMADMRPLVLIRLILATGIKKGELMRLQLGDITPQSVAIRYTTPRSIWKSRRLPLPADLAESLWLYRENTPALDAAGQWFPFCKKTIENIVASAGDAAGLKQRLSCETLRRIYAVESMLSGLDPELLRQRLALAPLWWPHTWKRLKAMSRLRELPPVQ